MYQPDTREYISRRAYPRKKNISPPSPPRARVPYKIARKPRQQSRPPNVKQQELKALASRIQMLQLTHLATSTLVPASVPKEEVRKEDPNEKPVVNKILSVTHTYTGRSKYAHIEKRVFKGKHPQIQVSPDTELVVPDFKEVMLLVEKRARITAAGVTYVEVNVTNWPSFDSASPITCSGQTMLQLSYNYGTTFYTILECEVINNLSDPLDVYWYNSVSDPGTTFSNYPLAMGNPRTYHRTLPGAGSTGCSYTARFFIDHTQLVGDTMYSSDQAWSFVTGNTGVPFSLPTDLNYIGFAASSQGATKNFSYNWRHKTLTRFWDRKAQTL